MTRHDPTRAYRPRRAPTTVEDHDACALYASAAPRTRAPPTTPSSAALVALEKMLHRAGNVDGEGDGCGLMRRHPARAVGGGGPLRRPRPEPRARSALRRRARVRPARRGRRGRAQGARARDDEPDRAARARRARRPRSTSTALGPQAREEEPLFWQVGGLVRATARDRCFRAGGRARGRRWTSTWRRARADSVVYKVIGSPRRCCSGYFQDLARPAREDRRRCSATTATRRTPGRRSCACSRSACSATTARSTRSRRLRAEARMLGVPIRDDSSDSQDLEPHGRDADPPRRPVAAEAMELAVPPIVNEISGIPEDLRGFYMYLRQAMGPFAQGPIALIVAPRRRVRVLRRRARPAPAVADRGRRRATCSAREPGVVAGRRHDRRSPSRSRPARR